MSVAYQIESPETIIDITRCGLQLEVAPDHLVLSVLNLDTNQFVGLQYVNLEKINTLQHLKEVLSTNKWLGAEYAKITIVYNFPEALLVPVEGYKSAFAPTYLDHIFGDLARGIIYEDFDSGAGSVCIYRIPNSLHETLTIHFKHAGFRHAFTVFLQRLKKQYALVTGEEAFIVFYERRFLLGCFKEGKLTMLRYFEYETAEDVCFHLLNTFTRLQMDCETALLRVSGLLETQSPMYSGLQKYFLNVELEERPAVYQYSDAFDAYPAHFFTSLFAVALCE